MNIRAELNSLDLASSQMLNEVVSLPGSLEANNPLSPLSQIDFEESKAQGKVTVRAGVHTHLDELRELQVHLPHQLDRVAADLRGQPAFRPTTRQIGYLICVPGGEMIDMAVDPTLEQQFASDEYHSPSWTSNSVYLKNSRMTELDLQLGDVASFIVDKEIEILDELQSLLQQCSPGLLAAHAALCQIDCLVAFARAATMYDLKRPILVEEQVIRLKGSRHALKALSDEGFVPNDIELQGGFGLPFESAKQAVAAEDEAGSQRDELVGDAGLRSQQQPRPESQEQPRPASQRSAVTDSRDTDTKYSIMVLTGANSSGKSCLLQQAALAVWCGTLHCDDLRLFATRARMSYRLICNASPSLLLPTLAQTFNCLTYLYRLRPGFAGTSHACHCARLCGVPDLVVKRAERIRRIGLRAWHDSEAARDEAVVRRLLQLELGNGEEGAEQQRIKEQLREVDDEEAMKWLQWVLTGDEVVDEGMLLGVAQGQEDE
ncbi:hypothetical protein [Sporisorium scitamineum]|uniref:DNA mismatch repair proteins mutS family domain-containing protein n=1 Tax=Sporisorium scitamineum TaxID=49012 RepID=A0A0F7SB69_9BASI|nr:hypothetical protein [Sporisorium scitamineum]